MDPLTGPQLRLTTAHTKIENLKSVLVTFGNNLKSDGITADKDPNTGEMILRFRVTKSTDADPQWSIAISEIAHLLRSCLDNLAWQLALLNTPDPFRSTEYPIYFNCRTKTGSGYIPSAIAKKRANDREVPKYPPETPSNDGEDATIPQTEPSSTWSVVDAP